MICNLNIIIALSSRTINFCNFTPQQSHHHPQCALQVYEQSTKSFSFLMIIEVAKLLNSIMQGHEIKPKIQEKDKIHQITSNVI